MGGATLSTVTGRTFPPSTPTIDGDAVADYSHYHHGTPADTAEQQIVVRTTIVASTQRLNRIRKSDRPWPVSGS